MEYEQMELNSPLHGLDVRTPYGNKETIILENLSPYYELDNLRPIFGEIKKSGVKNIVIDLSQVPEPTKLSWMAFLEGVMMTLGFEANYTGITIDEDSIWERDFKEYIAPKIAKSWDEAIERFSYHPSPQEGKPYREDSQQTKD